MFSLLGGRGGGLLVWVRTRGYILGWYDWNPPMLPCGGNEPDDRQRLAWNFMHWERFRAYIKLARSFVIVNLYIYGCKYVIRRCVLSISLWLGCALWHIDQSTRGRDRRKVRWGGGLVWNDRDLDFGHLQDMMANLWLIFSILGNFPL